MKTQLREQAVQLRLQDELSYTEIRKRLGVSKSTLGYWLRDFPLDEKRILELRRRGWQAGEAGREKFRLAMKKKQELKDLETYKLQYQKLANISEGSFFVAGLMIYLGEGDKKNPHRVGLANTDSQIIKFFVKWLVDFFDVPKEKLRAELHLYENMDIAQETAFWKNELDFHDSQFYKTQIRKLRKGSFSYKDSFRHGTCSLFLSSVEKKREIMMAIKAFLDKYNQWCHVTSN